ncbi:MAG: fibronectin/fibrinogen-binding protein [Chloroflexi bacterium]|nr:MAG: fibronectin/fibrinogen-binding protein [Chloroflexota bacterium]
MYLDVFTISALVDEFMDSLVGGRIQDVLDVDETGIGMEIYANHRRQYFYASADANRPRLHLTEEKLRRGLQRPTQLGLLMRRYIEGGRVVHVSQPDWERILHLHIEGQEGEYELIIEPMERRSNILLVQDGVIMDCMRRVGPEDNRYRLSLPNHAYQPPPPITGKREPLSITLEEIDTYFEQVTDPKYKAYQVLTGHVLGMSPLLAREIIYRAMGEANIKAVDADSEAVLDALHTIITPLMRRDWQPGIAETEDEGVIAYSVHPITYLGAWHPTESISAAIVAYYGAPVGEEAYTAAKKPVFAAIREAKAKLTAKLESLQSGLKDDAEREKLRKSGELILAYQYILEKGQTELRAQYNPDEPELVIQLDPNLSPLENAQRYFTRYNKSKRALDDVPVLIEEAQNELAYLDQLETDLELASNWSDIDDVQSALQAGGYWQGKGAKRVGGGGQSAPIRFVTQDGYVIWVGRNSRQNEIVTFKKANSDDLWLHARDVPGAHVIIKNDGRRIPEDVIEQAGSIAAYYSKRRADGRVPVDVTRVKYVRKIKGAARGMVTYRNERTISVVPKSEKAFE